MQILTVDSDSLFIESVRSVVKDTENSLFIAFDNDTAIQTLKENSGITLVIVDYDMAPKGAFHLVSGIRKNFTGKRIWITRNDSRPMAKFYKEHWMEMHRVEKFSSKSQAAGELAQEFKSLVAG